MCCFSSDPYRDMSPTLPNVALSCTEEQLRTPLTTASGSHGRQTSGNGQQQPFDRMHVSSTSGSSVRRMASSNASSQGRANGNAPAGSVAASSNGRLTGSANSSEERLLRNNSSPERIPPPVNGRGETFSSPTSSRLASLPSSSSGPSNPPSRGPSVRTPASSSGGRSAGRQTSNTSSEDHGFIRRLGRLTLLPPVRVVSDRDDWSGNRVERSDSTRSRQDYTPTVPLEDLQVAQKFTDFRTANRLSWSYRKDPAPAFSEARLEEQKATLKEVEKAKLEVLCRNREDLWVHKYHSPRAERELFNKKEKGKGKETEKEEVNEKEKEKETEKK